MKAKKQYGLFFWVSIPRYSCTLISIEATALIATVHSNLKIAIPFVNIPSFDSSIDIHTIYAIGDSLKVTVLSIHADKHIVNGSLYAPKDLEKVYFFSMIGLACRPLLWVLPFLLFFPFIIKTMNQHSSTWFFLIPLMVLCILMNSPMWRNGKRRWWLISRQRRTLFFKLVLWV